MHETKIAEKIKEETKPLSEICEKLECAVKLELEKGIENVDTKELGEVIDMVKDLYEAKEKLIKSCHYKKIMEFMEKDEEEEKEWKKIREMMASKESEMGVMDDMPEQRMYYRGQPRSRTSGRYMSRGDGRRSNRGRRGYTEPLMMPADEYDPYFQAYLRGEPERMYYEDNIRSTGVSTATASGEPYINPNEMNRYYSGGGTSTSGGGSTSGGTSTMSGSRGSGSSGGSSYYSDGRRDGRSRNEGRSGRSRSYYMEAKEHNSGNSVNDNNAKMQGLKKYAKELGEDLLEMTEGSSMQEKEMLKQELRQMADKI